MEQQANEFEYKTVALRFMFNRGQVWATTWNTTRSMHNSIHPFLRVALAIGRQNLLRRLEIRLRATPRREPNKNKPTGNKRHILPAPASKLQINEDGETPWVPSNLGDTLADTEGDTVSPSTLGRVKRIRLETKALSDRWHVRPTRLYTQNPQIQRPDQTQSTHP
jgi:hypothetical protein